MSKDSEISQHYSAVKEARRERNMARFLVADRTGWTQYTDIHWQRDLCGDRLDYWPTTGKWRWRGKTYRGNDNEIRGFIRNREVTP